MINIYELLKKTGEVLIFGDLIIDSYIEVDTTRISSEYPVPVYEKSDIESLKMGGAGNVLNNLLQLDIDAKLISIINNKYIDTLINSENIINIEDNTYNNIVKTRYFSNNYHCFRLDNKNNYIISKKTIEKFKSKLKEILHTYKCVIISDYNTGIVIEEIVQFIISECNNLDIPTLIDPKNNYNMYKNCYIIKPNKKDAEKFCNFDINNIDDAYKACDIFMNKLNIKNCIITLSDKGCVFKNKIDESNYIPCETIHKGKFMDVTGAGDTFIAGYFIGILNNLNYQETCHFCNLLCSDVIKRMYVSPVNILNILRKHNNIISDINYCYILKKYLFNKKIIFTAGGFDLIHEGHIDVIKKAKELGDILIVALNTDESIKKLKGNNRPINTLNTRLNVLSSVKYIDFIIVFSEDTPNTIFEIIKPDILVKGGDYSFKTIKTIFPTVKEYVSIPLINNISTTCIINKIKN